MSRKVERTLDLLQQKQASDSYSTLGKKSITIFLQYAPWPLNLLLTKRLSKNQRKPTNVWWHICQNIWSCHKNISPCIQEQIWLEVVRVRQPSSKQILTAVYILASEGIWYWERRNHTCMCPPVSIYKLSFRYN